MVFNKRIKRQHSAGSSTNQYAKVLRNASSRAGAGEQEHAHALIMSSISASGSEASTSDFDDDEEYHKVDQSSGVVKRATRARRGTASAKKLARKTPLF